MSRGVCHPPNMLEHFEAALGGLTGDRLGLVLDFDGTLSEFVPDLDKAVISCDVVPPLLGLARKLTLTAAMSGRAARDLEQRVGIDGLVYIGNHGAERILDGALSVVEGAESSESELQALLERFGSAANDPGIVLENKAYSASLHYRRASDEAGVKERLRSALGDIPKSEDLEFFWGNKILEIRRRNGVNKGFALDRVIRDWQLDVVIFAGDDTTDADALRVLRRLRASGDIGGLGIAVIQDGTPSSVLDNADYSLDGVPEVTTFLSRLDAAIG